MSIFKDIVTSDKPDYQAVTGAAAAANINGQLSTWESLLRTWLAINYIQASGGLYEYKGENALNLTIQPFTAGSASLRLGEAVYSVINSTHSGKSDAGNIRYAGLNKSGNGSVTTPNSAGGTNFSSSHGDRLLVFNASTNNCEQPPYPCSIASATGDLTGVSASVISASMSVAPSSALQQPYRIDARDLLGRHDLNRLPATMMLTPLGSGDE